MPLDFAELGGEFTKSLGEHLLEFGIGTAVAESLRPEAERLAQEAWSIQQTKVLDPADAASIVAENVEELQWGEKEAAQSGINADRFARLVKDNETAPGLQELLLLWRMGIVSDTGFQHGLRKLKLQPLWYDALQKIRTLPLTPQEIAEMIQRGVIPDPGILPVPAPTEVGKVPPMPTINVDPYKAAAAWGASEENLKGLTRIIGLPPSPQMAAQMFFRSIIERVDFDRALAEGNTRNEWKDVILEGAREILTAHDYVELRLRGWIGDKEMYDGTAKHGMSKADTDLLHKVLGRPIPIHQITTGLARKGEYNGPTDHIPEAYLKSLQEGNERPEWYNLSYANRYSIPSYFVLKALLADGTLSEPEGADYFKQLGWPPDLSEKAAKAYAVAQKTVPDKHVAKAEVQLWTTIHKSYVSSESDDAQAESAFADIGIDPAAFAQILTLWKHERAIVRKTLSVKQIIKAYTEANSLPAGEGLTRTEAHTRLTDLGYSSEDANRLLDE